MSETSSQSTSREMSPISKQNMHNYQIVVVKKVKENQKRRKYFLIPFILIFLLCLANVEPESYCSEKYDVICKKCPKHASCFKNKFVCDRDFYPFENGCFSIDPATNITAIRKDVRNYIFNNNVWSFTDVVNNFTNYKSKEIKIALISDGKMKIFNNEIIPVFRFSNEFIYFVLGVTFTTFVTTIIISKNIVI